MAPPAHRRRLVDHVDTAEFCGDGTANEIIRRALGPGDDVVVVKGRGAEEPRRAAADPAPAQQSAELRDAVEDILRTLGLDRIEVVNLRRLDVGPGITATARSGSVPSGRTP